MVKKRGLLIIVGFVLILSGLNIFMFTNKDSGLSYTSLTGQALQDLPGFSGGLNFSVIAFIAQWILLLAILFFAYSRFLKHKQQENMDVDFSLIKKKKGKAETDLDTLYSIIQQKKNLSIGGIARLFNITKDKALEWGKILENHELVKIEYPAFSAPEIRLNDKKSKGKEDKKNEKASQKDKEAEGQKDKEAEGQKDKEASQKEKPGKKGKNQKEEDISKDRKNKETGNAQKDKEKQGQGRRNPEGRNKKR